MHFIPSSVDPGIVLLVGLSLLILFLEGMRRLMDGYCAKQVRKRLDSQASRESEAIKATA